MTYTGRITYAGDDTRLSLPLHDTCLSFVPLYRSNATVGIFCSSDETQNAISDVIANV